MKNWIKTNLEIELIVIKNNLKIIFAVLLKNAKISKKMKRNCL
jgi:hypothetical protein